jgi:hypothetical protein
LFERSGAWPEEHDVRRELVGDGGDDLAHDYEDGIENQR